MTHSSYTPGRWTAVLTDGFVAVLEPAAAPATSLDLWAGAGAGASFVDALSVGCYVAAGVTLAGSIAAFVLLPDHPTITEDA